MDTRDILLKALKKNKGTFVSGEALSHELGISRAAVSKHVAILKNTGYAISSTPGKGYVFRENPDLLLPGEIRHGLDTRIFGHHLIDYHTLITSTNDRAKELASAGVPEGTLVLAEEQTAGRGRKGRPWFSTAGDGICLSLILRPHMSPSEASRITLMTAVALSETLLGLTRLPVLIKWPNDILIKGKKLAGILTEMSMEMDQVDFVVVGLGLNVNSPPDHFSPEVREIASSLLIETGTTWNRAALVREFLKWFENYYSLIQGQGFSAVMKRWKELSDIIGRDVTVDMLGSRIQGCVEDVDDEGVLILRDPSGIFHRVISGDVLLKDI
ncbi:MAG: biotin--[acetyl-CoA-carboxylase] ligase [Proteobacteria bacterium]|nr:biotin--[acetyl-CoA-carboxylase] ligase [Pseudomonadota bacterium]